MNPHSQDCDGLPSNGYTNPMLAGTTQANPMTGLLAPMEGFLSSPTMNHLSNTISMSQHLKIQNQSQDHLVDMASAQYNPSHPGGWPSSAAARPEDLQHYPYAEAYGVPQSPPYAESSALARAWTAPEQMSYTAPLGEMHHRQQRLGSLSLFEQTEFSRAPFPSYSDGFHQQAFEAGTSSGGFNTPSPGLISDIPSTLSARSRNSASPEVASPGSDMPTAALGMLKIDRSAESPASEFVEKRARRSASLNNKGEEPYAQLIYRAFMSRPRHSMTLQELYQWFRDNTDKATGSQSRGWQNSIRHNLSMNAVSSLLLSSTSLH